MKICEKASYYITCQHTALNGGSHGHSLVGVDSLGGGASEDFLASVLKK